MYGSTTTTGVTALPATGAALGSIWLLLAGLTIAMLILAVIRLAPKAEA